jgi:hypothetical protein
MPIVFMPLLQKGTDVWRLIEVTPLEGGLYRVEGSMPDDEVWRFMPGSVIDIKWQKFADGESRWVPKGPAPTIRSVVAALFQSSAGVLLGVYPLLMIVKWLPHQPDEHLESVPFLLASAAVALLAAILLIWRKPDALVVKTALWSALVFGIFCSLLSLTNDA